MSGKVWVRRWDDTVELFEAVAVDVAPNGIVDVTCCGANGKKETSAWWKWHSEGARDLYGYIDELATLPGWSPALRELIFSNLEARRDGRMGRYVSSLTGQASQERGSAFNRPSRASRP